MATFDGSVISTADVLATANSIRSLNDKLTAKLEEIQNEMRNLSNTWQSPAGETIRSNFDALAAKAFGNYKDIISAYATFLDNTAASYEATETQIQNNADLFH